MHADVNWPADKAALYPLLTSQISALANGLPLPLPALANAAALLWEAMPDINWAGFYLRKADTLYLGPFQGKVACTVIPFGRGVCGTAAQTGEIQLVPDVHLFPGHIACDSASNSEIVLPLVVKGEVVGVLDIDSPLLGRFDQQDADGLRAFADVLTSELDWSSLL